MKYTKQEQAEALAKLRSILKPGTTVHTVSRHTSRSGMSRSISLFVLLPGDSAPMDISHWAARILGDSIDQRHGGIRIGGCGMDMGFKLVYDLSSRLFPNGFGCIGAGDEYGTHCPSNDHSNGDRDYTPHSAGKPLHELAPDGEKECWQNPNGRPHWHASGGYALRHRWM